MGVCFRSLPSSTHPGARDVRRAGGSDESKAQMQYRIALMSKTFLQRGVTAFTVR
jgi:hypothetical protein